MGAGEGVANEALAGAPKRRKRWIEMGVEEKLDALRDELRLQARAIDQAGRIATQGHAIAAAHEHMADGRVATAVVPPLAAPAYALQGQEWRPRRDVLE